jgi:uncharacterized protein (DUF488 family)
VSAPTLFTLGHSTHPWPELLEILHAHNIRAIADVRQYPGSRRFPHFNAEHLAQTLPAEQIGYLPFRDLGGRRKPNPHSINVGWRNAMFRGYADYMQTPEFTAAIERLENVAKEKPTAIMCSEAVPWRCHRSLIADAMLSRGWDVIDIYDARQAKQHTLNPMAVVSGEKIIYPLAYE